MINYATMSKADLLAAAKSAAIPGRWEMTKTELADALAGISAQPDSQVHEDDRDESAEEDEDQSDGELLVIDMERAAESAPIDPEVIKDTKRRYPSSAKRDSLGKVIRRGVKFNLNVPFANKYYFLPAHLSDETKWTDAYKAAVSAAPPQAQLIVKAMGKHGVTSGEDAMLGAQIVDLAKSRGGLATKTGSRELFAYYRRLLERLGVVHAAEYGNEPEEA